MHRGLFCAPPCTTNALAHPTSQLIVTNTIATGKPAYCSIHNHTRRAGLLQHTRSQPANRLISAYTIVPAKPAYFSIHNHTRRASLFQKTQSHPANRLIAANAFPASRVTSYHIWKKGALPPLSALFSISIHEFWQALSAAPSPPSEYLSQAFSCEASPRHGPWRPPHGPYRSRQATR